MAHPDRPNIHAEVTSICRKLGLDPNDVRQLDIGVSTIEAHVYLRHPDTGAKYIPPGGTDAAQEIRTLVVSTASPVPDSGSAAPDFRADLFSAPRPPFIFLPPGRCHPG